MFSTCPNCETVQPLTAALLAQAGGTVRCTGCGRDFDALASLCDDQPEESPHAAEPERPDGVATSASGSAAIASADAHPEEARRVTGKDPNRPVWVAILAILVLVTISNLAWTFREPLLEQPWVKSRLTNLGMLKEAPRAPFRDLAAIRLLSRDLHSHPTRAGILVLSATFVSRSSRPQPWPRLELTLLDSSNMPLARRGFAPTEYLGRQPGAAELFAPDTHVPVVLEFADPGALATGFELRFR